MADWKLKIDVERPDVKGAEAALKKLFKELDRIDKIANKVEKDLEKAVKVKKPKPLSFKDIVGANFVANVGSRGAAGAVRALTTAVGLYIDATKRAVSSSAKFENAIVSIARISGSTEKSIADMSNEFRLLSTEVPVSVGEFQKFADTASRFGIKGSAGIKAFAQTFGRLQSIVGPVSEETAKSVARIASLTDFPIEEIDKFANSVIVLGKNFATSEDQIVRTAERVAQDIAQFGSSTAEVLGLATALDALGIKSEKGGSALLRVLDAIQAKAIEAGSDFGRLAELSGLTAEAFADVSLASPVKAFEALIASGASGSEIMDRLGLAGVRVQSVLAAMAKRSDTFAKSMADSNENMKTNTELLGDAERQAETNASKIIRLGNAFESVFIGIGSSATDQTGELLDKVLGMTDAFIGITESSKAAFPEIAKLGETAKDLFSTALTTVDDLVDAFEDSAPVIDAWAKRLEDAAGVIGKISKFASGIGQGIDFAIDFITPKSIQLALKAGRQGSEDGGGSGALAPFFKSTEDILNRGDRDSIFDDAFFNTFKVIAAGIEGGVEDAKAQISERRKLESNLLSISEKVIESQRSPIDALGKKAESIALETSLKGLGLDDIEKRQAKASISFNDRLDKLTATSSRLEEAGLDTTEIDSVILSLIGNFTKFDDALEVSGLTDDIKKAQSSLSKVSEDLLDLDKDEASINQSLPQISAITDVVSAGQFISQSREEEKRSAQEKEKIMIARQSLKAQEGTLKEIVKRADTKIAHINKGS